MIIGALGFLLKIAAHYFDENKHIYLNWKMRVFTQGLLENSRNITQKYKIEILQN